MILKIGILFSFIKVLWTLLCVLVMLQKEWKKTVEILGICLTGTKIQKESSTL